VGDWGPIVNVSVTLKDAVIFWCRARTSGRECGGTCRGWLMSALCGAAGANDRDLMRGPAVSPAREARTPAL
jgi:hypothetical protein